MNQQRTRTEKFSPRRFHAALSGNYKRFWIVLLTFGLVGSAFYAYSSAASTYKVSVSMSAYNGTWPTEILKDAQFSASDTYVNTGGTGQYPLIRMSSDASGLGKNRRASVTINCAHDQPVLQWVQPFLSFTGWELNTSQAVPTLMSTGAGSVTGGYLVNGSGTTTLNVHVAKKSLDPTRSLTCVGQVLVQEKSRGTWRNVAIAANQTITLMPSGK